MPAHGNEQEKYTVRSVLNDPAAETERAMGRRAESTPLDRAKKWAMEYLKRPRSEKEVRARLREKGCEPQDIDEVVARCLDYGFINDAEYAAAIARHYAGRGYGPGRVRTELIRRGIPKELWDAALAELPEDTDTIDRVLASRLRGRDAGDRKERDKAANALYRRGYSWEDIRAALARYGEADDDLYDI